MKQDGFVSRMRIRKLSLPYPVSRVTQTTDQNLNLVFNGKVWCHLSACADRTRRHRNT